MKRIMFVLGILYVTLCTHPPLVGTRVCYSAFEDIGCGARPAGMGNAFCAIADDINAFLYNPSGLSQLNKLQIGTMYAQLYPGLSDKSNIANNFLAIAYPFGEKSSRITLGFAWFNVGVISDPERLNVTYKENTYIISYAKNIEFISIGLSIKLHTKEYGQNYWTEINPTFNKTRTASGVGFDAGLLYRPNKELTIGFSMIDFNQPYVYIATPSQVPLVLKIGLGYKFEPTWTFEDIVGAIDITYRDGEYKGYAGLEGWLLDKSVGLRTGFGIGSLSFANIVIGVSYQLTEEMYNNDFRIDYAFGYPLSGLQTTAGTHRISLTVGFGPK